MSKTSQATGTNAVRIQYRNFTPESNEWQDLKDEKGMVIIYEDTAAAQAVVAALRASGDNRTFRFKAAFAQRYFGV